MSKLVDLLIDVPTLAVAHERLALARDEIQRLEREIDRLTEENIKLRSQVAKAVPPEFLEHRGVLWKRRADGRIDDLAYCPKCRLALSAFPPGGNIELICTSCQYGAPFRPSEIHANMPQ